MNPLRRISSFFKRSTEKTTAVAAAAARHILDFAEGQCKLRTEGNLLVIEKADGTLATVPFAEIAAVLLSSPHISVSQSVLQSLAEAGSIVVVCNYKHMPVSMTLPTEPHSLPVERLKLQIEASQPTIKNAWQQVARAKIQAQARLLIEEFKDDAGLMKLADSVRSGDPDNIEAQAAKKYWAALFPEIDFHRNHDANDPLNARLNYGYTIVRSMTARAVCASGFHPALGIHHHSVYDAFCLADDLMEPYRPEVDSVVRMQFKISRKLATRKLTRELTGRVKQELIHPLTRRFQADGERRKLFEIITKTVQSLVHFYKKETDVLYLPVLQRCEGE
jgi:CRISPR-associated protein Cas1